MQYAPLNNHEYARRQLWNGVYVAAMERGNVSFIAAAMADAALMQFDERFAPPEPRY